MNMCSVRHSPIPSAPNRCARAASSGVSAFARHANLAQFVGPAQDGLEARVDVGLDERNVIDGDDAVRAVDRDEVAGVQDEVVDPHLAHLEVDIHAAAPVTAGTAHAARHQCRVRGLASLGGEDPHRGVEAGDVIGLGERP